MHNLIVRAPKDLPVPGLSGVRREEIIRRVRPDAVDDRVHVAYLAERAGLYQMRIRDDLVSCSAGMSNETRENERTERTSSTFPFSCGMKCGLELPANCQYSQSLNACSAKQH